MSQPKSSTPESSKEHEHDPQLWRDLVGFWFMGLCNVYGFFIMLLAAHDLLHDAQNYEEVYHL